MLYFPQGHGCCPMLFDVDVMSGKIQYVGKLDASLKKETSSVSAMNKFKSLDRHARTETNDTSLETLHQNAITNICLHTGTKAGASKFSTAGVDGLLAVWDLKVSFVFTDYLDIPSDFFFYSFRTWSQQ